jgi:D-tyrosyl-tRNA(Tyr) deacylase
MKFVIQRVRKASVHVREKTIGSIEKGLLVLVGIQRGDTEQEMQWMIRKTVRMRIFEGDEGKMNQSVSNINGAILLIPNFTLYADVSTGNRPGFSEAEKFEKARELYKRLIKEMNNQTDLRIETGEFGADMDVSLINDGPVTIILEREAAA